MGVRVRGLGRAAAPESSKAIIFRANAKFFGQKPAAKKDFLFAFIEQKTEFVPCTEMIIARNPGFLLTIIGWGDWAKQLCRLM